MGRTNSLKRPILSYLLAPAVLLSAACSSVSASQPLMLSGILDQQTTTTATAPPQSSIPQPSSGRKYELLLGPQADVYFPTSSKTQDAYGSSWTSISVGIGSAYQANPQGSISPFLTILYNTHDSNRAFLLPVGVGYEKSLSSSPTSGYYGIDAVLLAADQLAPSYGVHSGFRYGGGVRPLVGYEFGRNAYVQGSYLFASSIKSFDFSGATIEAGFRF
jgi:hypothetical protein